MENPLSDLPLSDEKYEELMKNGLLSAKGIRDYLIHEKYIELRATMRADAAIEIINVYYPHLQHESIRKLIHTFPTKLQKLYTPYHLIKEEA
jgi:hypothetical protein